MESILDAVKRSFLFDADNDDFTPIDHATGARQRLEKSLLRLSPSASATEPSPDAKYLLLNSAANGEIITIDVALTQGADINTVDMLGNTILHYCKVLNSYALKDYDKALKEI